MELILLFLPSQANMEKNIIKNNSKELLISYMIKMSSVSWCQGFGGEKSLLTVTFFEKNTNLFHLNISKQKQIEHKFK